MFFWISQVAACLPKRHSAKHHLRVQMVPQANSNTTEDEKMTRHRDKDDPQGMTMTPEPQQEYIITKADVEKLEYHNPYGWGADIAKRCRSRPLTTALETPHTPTQIAPARIYLDTATPDDFTNAEINDWIYLVGDISTQYELNFIHAFGVALHSRTLIKVLEQCPHWKDAKNLKSDFRDQIEGDHYCELPTPEQVARAATLAENKRVLNWMDQLEYYISCPESCESHQSAWNYLKRLLKESLRIQEPPK
jgi:hypothetical protein